MALTAHAEEVATELKSVVEMLGAPGAELDYIAALKSFANDSRYRLLMQGKREPLLAEEVEALNAIGVDTDFRPAQLGQVFKSSGLLGHIRATAVPLAVAARRLGVSDSRLRQRIGEGELLSIRGADGRSHLIPAFQLTEDGELPGLRKVLAAIRPDTKLLTIYGFFMTPQPDLESEDGEPMTPMDWLMSGEDVDAVAELASDI